MSKEVSIVFDDFIESVLLSDEDAVGLVEAVRLGVNMLYRPLNWFDKTHTGEEVLLCTNAVRLIKVRDTTPF